MEPKCDFCSLASLGRGLAICGMEKENDSFDLSGKLLVAMPGMGDPRFEKTVIFMCDHSPDGAMGLIVNRPDPMVKTADLLKQLGISPSNNSRDIKAHFGGPVEHGRGFVLHSADYRGDQATLPVDDRFAMTATVDVLEELAQGRGPDSALLMLGYSGWGPGQIEDEIVSNGWLTCDATPEIVFGADSDAKWVAALGELGVNPLTLSAAAGRA